VNARAERATRVAVVAAVLLGLLAVVALTSSRERPSVSGGTDAGAVAELRDVFLTVGATLYAVALVAAMWLLWKLRGGGRGTGPHLSLGAFLIFVVLVSGIYWGIRNHQQPKTPELNAIPLGPGRPQLQPPPAQQHGATKPLPPAEFRWELAGGLLAAIALGVLLVVMLRRRRAEEVELEPLARRERIAAELATIVEGTIDDLRREDDPRRAVIAAYAQMETALAHHGLPRERSEAPFEFLARMLRELQVRAASALALTELFERARFSDHVIDSAMKNEAIEALVAVRDDLRAAPA
jgi:Domain of unknown function (DUF4129)